MAFRASKNAFHLSTSAYNKFQCISWTIHACSAGSQRECTADKREVGEILRPQAIDALATRLRTPLQIQQHLTFALDAGYQAGVTPVTVELVEQLYAKPAEIRALFANQLDPPRTAELRAELQMAGLPI